MVQASIESGDMNPFSIRDDDFRTKSFSKAVPSITAEAFKELIIEVSSVSSQLISTLTSFVGQKGNGHRLA